MSAPLPSYDEPQLAAAVERLSPEQIDDLPFGAIRLDQAGIVRFYSRAESRLSGYGQRPALGRHFFTEIAPCMDHEHYRGRLERARTGGRLDIEFTYVGDFNDAERELQVRIQSASDGGLWIFMRRPD